MMLKSDAQQAIFVENDFWFFMIQTDCINVSAANELQAERG